MCGLTGFWNRSRNQTTEQLMATVSAMSQTLHHRGPDDAGIWTDPSVGIALGHQRLSIIDLSPTGHQPMTSRCGRYVIAFNGEIYNHAELRRDLVAVGRTFRGLSDTEVLVEGFATWGIDSTIRRCVGMFAIAVWDTRDRTLSLIRDRIGKKPLYYGRCRSVLLFGSELKSLRAHPDFVGEIDRQSLSDYFQWCYIRHPATIYRGVQMLPPGTILTLGIDAELPQPISYWSLTDVADSGIRRAGERGQISLAGAAEQLDERLTEAVACRMVADVPLGAFLSGGIDSSLVVALMQKQSNRPVRTFTIGFEDPAYDEAPYAAAVAGHLQTDHVELQVTSAQARDVIPRLPTIFDEPFADSSQIPTFLVSQLARQHVTVALSGDGGDEIFCGYRRYFEALEGFDGRPLGSGRASAVLGRLVHFIRQSPKSLKIPIQALVTGLARLPMGRVSNRFAQLSRLLHDSGPVDRYLRNLSHWCRQTQIVVGTSPPVDCCDLRGRIARCDNPQQSFQWYDSLTYLPDDILTKVDRASMAVSLEARTPLLDHRVVEFAWTLPHDCLVQGTTGKRILREVLSRYVPARMFERPKMGFGVPIDRWLRGPLRDWAEDLLDEHRLRQEGYLNPLPIRQKWAEHLTGRGNWHYLLWDVLMFQAWLRQST
ncbi:MAG: asparagine synthase (glutamine-hydrolyzing) [Planctomycetes bacterium]|nr:asparagine synthase (glutamine-hydrolyzing) [Planctomycetota bacterium]